MSNAQTVEQIFAALMGDGAEKVAGEEVKAPEAVQAETAPVEAEAAPAVGEDKTASAFDGLKKVAEQIAQNPQALKGLEDWLETESEKEKIAEDVKKAEEAVATGRFMARGFIDELNKVSADLPNYGGGAAAAANFSSANLTKGVASQTSSTPNVIQDDENSTAVGTAKKEDAQKSPSSPTASADTVHVVKAIVDAASQASQTQARQEVPNNLGV